MSKEIDWSKAPEGAMCYVHEWGFFKCEHGEWWVSQGDVWQRTPYSSPENFSWFGNVVWRGKQWNGAGLPPVGAVCECQNNEMKWLQGTIVYVGKDNGTPLAIMQTKTEILYGEAGEFRPIRTPEQIAAEEREKAIDEMHGMIDSDRAKHFRLLCEALYDAGYRKTDAAK